MLINLYKPGILLNLFSWFSTRCDFFQKNIHFYLTRALKYRIFALAFNNKKAVH